MGSAQAVRGKDIATSTGADPVLVGRILRNLAALGHIDEIGVESFKANKVTYAFTTAKGINGANFSYVHTLSKLSECTWIVLRAEPPQCYLLPRAIVTDRSVHKDSNLRPRHGMRFRPISSPTITRTLPTQSMHRCNGRSTAENISSI